MKKLLFLIILFCASAFAESEFKIFTLQHRFASDLIPVVTQIVGDSGTVTGMNNQLIVRADAVEMRQVEAFVAQTDIERANRKITVKSFQDTQVEQNTTQASGNVKVGKVTVANNRRTPPNSGRVDVERNKTSSQHASNQFIQVLDGERAFIKVGQIVPFTQEWIEITKRYAYIDKVTGWQEISTGFAVRPKTIGNQVELEIMPRISKLNSNQTIDFEELSTVVRVSLGEWVDIGGTMQKNDDVSRKILGNATSYSLQNSGLSVKVD